LPFISWVCFRTAVRVMFELKTEEMGGKGCIMVSSIIYSANQTLGLWRTLANGWGMWRAWDWRQCWKDFWLEDVKERVHSEGMCECGRIILKCILRNCIRMDFDYSCFGSVLNDILMNSFVILKFHKILRNMLIRRATTGISVNTLYYMCLFLWLAVYCFYWCVLFSASHSL